MKTYIVLGMHRSATSFLAKALLDQGVDMGKRLMGPGEFNPQGHFENLDFVELNDLILATVGGSWDDPPSREKIASAGQQVVEKIKSVVEKSKGEKWGWKDPRTSLTLDLFLPFLEDDVYLFVCFRKPRRVAESLNRRDGMPIGKGLELARIYNERLLESIKHFLSS